MGKKAPVSVSLDRSTLRQLDEMAQAEGRSRSGMVRWLVRNAPRPTATVVHQYALKLVTDDGTKEVGDV